MECVLCYSLLKIYCTNKECSCRDIEKEEIYSKIERSEKALKEIALLGINVDDFYLRQFPQCKIARKYFMEKDKEA